MADAELASNEAVLDDGEDSSTLLRGAAKATVLLAAAGLLGQVFTMARELYIANLVGATIDLDAVLIAAVFPTMFASLLASGTSAALLPAYLEIRGERGRGPADRLVGATFSWTVVAGFALAVLLMAASGPFVAIAGPGLSPSAQAAAVGFVPILAPMLILSALSALLTAVFQIHGRLWPVAVAWVGGPLTSVIVTIAGWDSFGYDAFALAMTTQQAATVAVLMAFVVLFGYRPPITFRSDRADAVRFIRHAMPLTISASVLQFNLLTDRAVATLLTPGGVSALRYAEGVIRIPLNAIEPAWSAAIYPALVRASVLKESGSLGQAAEGAMRYVMAIFIPLSVATIALAPLIVDVAYVRGAFGEEAWQLTAACLAGFAPLLFFNMANVILSGAHNARRRGTFLMQMGISNAVLNVIFNVVLGVSLGVAGVALSTAVTVGAIQVVKAWRLARLDHGFSLRTMSVVLTRSLGACLAVAVPIGIIAWGLPFGIAGMFALTLLVSLTIGGLVAYVVIGRVLGLDEPWLVLQALLRPARALRRGSR